jgi:outer membrane lipoprotein LolB
MVTSAGARANSSPRPAPLRWVLLATILLAACAQPLRQHDASALAGSHWNGRFALTVQSEPAQSTSASFELSGSPSHGELRLVSPLGTTLAVLTWTPSKATLSQSSLEQTSDSLDELVAQATGTEIPVRALFDWLNGIPTEAPGWQVDLTQLPEGRLQVRRLTSPTVDLRLKVQQ